MKIRVGNTKSAKYLFAYFLIIVSCFFPAYLYSTNEQNLIFTMAEIPLFLFLVSQSYFLLRRKKYNTLFLFVVSVYFLIFLYIDAVYLGCYWALFYKTASFLFIWVLYQIKEQKVNSFAYFRSLEGGIILLFTISVLMSLLGFIIGLDAIHMYLPNISPRAQGVYSDLRLTWVFMHKSTYGLLLVGVLGLIFKRKSLPYRRSLIILYLLTIVIVNSMVSLVAALAVAFSAYIETKKITRQFLIRLVSVGLVALLVGSVVYYYLVLNRNLSSLGSRLYIWMKIPELFQSYPTGMGKQFSSVRVWVENAGFSVNNLHNVALNEALHYSIPVGILFTILVFYIPVHTIKNARSKLPKVVLMTGLVLPMVFDQALHDVILPFYLLILFLCFYDYEPIFGGERVGSY